MSRSEADVNTSFTRVVAFSKVIAGGFGPTIFLKPTYEREYFNFNLFSYFNN